MEVKETVTTINDGQGQCLSVVGDTYRIIMAGEQTDGNYAVIDMLVPPGGGPGPHAHKDIQEMFYVLEGEVEFKMEEGSYEAKKGSLVNIPLGGEIHCFKNTSHSVAHLLCTVVPAGLDAFFEEIGKPIATGTFLKPDALSPEELSKLKSIAKKYGQEVYPPDYLDKPQINELTQSIKT
jgi:quercetin dioxygenase-like cupin family protein